MKAMKTMSTLKQTITRTSTAILLASAMLLTGIILVGCGAANSGGNSSGSASGKSGETTYRMLYSAEVTTLNYLSTTSTNEFRIAANVEDCLVDYDSYGNIQPGLAESWESNADMTEWTFHLRDGIKWMNSKGEAVADLTAADFVSAARYINNAANDANSQYMYNTGAIVRNAQNYYDYTEYLLLSENGTRTTDEEGNPIEPVAEVRAEDIGVTAPDDHTLVYQLERPCSYFPSVTCYTSFLPVKQEYLDQWGESFASDEEHLLYCGAYILSEFEENNTHVLTRNPAYWDREHVYIDTISSTYDADRDYHEAYMFMNGEVDYARITESIRDEWLQDPAKKDQIHTQRPDYSYSYFYCFNFDPQFDAQYEPENWKLAVGNENFRKAVMTGMDRISAIAVKESLKPSVYLQNTITPKGFVSAAGKDFTQYDGLAAYADTDFYDIDQALVYKAQAMEELSAQGVRFPIKVPMPYNPSTPLWEQECYEMEAQLESTLGRDFLDVIVVEGPETGFLSSVRRSGDYALLKCNWGADYVDPETWSQPFREGGTYMFWDKSDNPEVQVLFNQWKNLTDEAFGYYRDEDLGKRFELYAQAENLLVEHAIVIPFSTFAGDGYVMSRVNEFEGGYAPCSLVAERYKFQHLQKDSMNQEEFDHAYEQWKQERDASLKGED